NFLQDYNEAHPEDKRLPELAIQGDSRLVMVDRLLVAHILRNLVSNALKYSQGKKNPELTIKFEKKLVTITIRDFGIGIPENDRKNLFQSFFRGSNVLTIPGTGLGLVIVKQFVEMHGGMIDLKSELDHGTTIHVILPI
ncbi:MAG TPA: ATP-binding protein, partial [Bacteroidia bacterium]|nr:ATP-binding protein [Bacteroidia bacterium]